MKTPALLATLASLTSLASPTSLALLVSRASLASLVRAFIAGAALMTLVGAVPGLAATVGVWEYDGFTSAEENEGAGATHSATVNMNFNGEEIFLTMSCYLADKSIGLSMGGRENFERSAQNAVKLTMGRFKADQSHVDMEIDGQNIAVQVAVYDINGELGFIDNHDVNGALVTGMLKGSRAYLDAPGLNMAVPLKNSANSICQALRQCGMIQSYCQQTGR